MRRLSKIAVLVAATTLLLLAESVALTATRFANENNMGPLILASVGLYWIWAYALDVSMLASLSLIPPGSQHRVGRIALLVVGIFCYSYGLYLLFSLGAK